MDSNDEQVVVQSEQTTKQKEEITIDLGRIFRALWHYIWIIILAIVLGAVIMFGYTKFFVTEMYTATATIYVRNASSNSSSSSSISSANEYVAEAVTELIVDYDTISTAIEYNNLPYTYKEVKASISTSVGESGNLYLSVEYSDPEAAADIANAILSVLEVRATEVYGSYIYVGIYSDAQVPTSKSSPNTTQNVIIGALVGAVLSCAVIAVLEILNNKIYENDYLITTYNIPVLTEIPDFSDKKSGKKYYTSQYGYGTKS